MNEPFWQRPLATLNHQEWEALCDRCGRCCLQQLQDSDSGKLFTTAVSCRYLALPAVTCNRYADRAQQQPDCVTITPENVTTLESLPVSCSYRLRASGLPLPAWHPLLSGNHNRMLNAGISVRHIAISAAVLKQNIDLTEFIISD
ncbi:MAG: YcgN family cysteine cluster protein [Gammaproteobacteria bacterium]|nr:YcgN family cysteine cluster protein [Gammaproteobacteria bacterium]